MNLLRSKSSKERASLDLLFSVSQEIHENPELNFEEYKASKLLASKLEEANFEVKLGVADLDTAIHAVHPNVSDGPTVAILAEYDALPEIGHGCGHNLIASAALGACLALGSFKKDIPGKLIFMGRPRDLKAIGWVFMAAESILVFGRVADHITLITNALIIS